MLVHINPPWALSVQIWVLKDNSSTSCYFQCIFHASNDRRDRWLENSRWTLKATLKTAPKMPFECFWLFSHRLYASQNSGDESVGSRQLSRLVSFIILINQRVSGRCTKGWNASRVRFHRSHDHILSDFRVFSTDWQQVLKWVLKLDCLQEFPDLEFSGPNSPLSLSLIHTTEDGTSSNTCLSHHRW